MEAIRRLIQDRIEIKDCGHRSPCWLWKRYTRDGYGRVDIGRHTYQAHRISYEAFSGTIGEGLTLDHLCCVTNCVNSAHLEPVTNAENLRRKSVRLGHVVGGKPYERRPRGERTPRIGCSVAGWQRALTHCPHGHEYTPENTQVSPTGIRRCRTCRRANNITSKRRCRELKAAAREFELIAGRGALNEQRPSFGAQRDCRRAAINAHSRTKMGHRTVHLGTGQ